MVGYKEGQKLFSVDFEEKPDGQLTFQSHEWIVRTIRGDKVTAIRRTRDTWVKRSTRHGDWGWAKSINKRDRVTFDVTRKVRSGVFLTLSEAWEDARDTVERYADDSEYKEMALRTCKAQISKSRGRRAGRY